MSRPSENEIIYRQNIHDEEQPIWKLSRVLDYVSDSIYDKFANNGMGNEEDVLQWKETLEEIAYLLRRDNNRLGSKLEGEKCS